MGFPQTIKNQVLVAAARHCCLCHRYKGVKIEVHHIVQEADGGANSLDNAISLCFDCHADAGHYNIHHPKGTKISPDELKLARDTWYKRVAEHTIQVPVDGTDELHVRYLVCRDGQISRKIIAGDLSDIPATTAFLVQNEILRSFNTLFALQDQLDKGISSWGDSFTDVGQYLMKHPDAEATDPSDFQNPYFRTIRIPKVDELQSLLDKRSLISFLLSSGLSVHDFLKAVGYPEFCGPQPGVEVYGEHLLCKQLWPVFLHITNVSESSVQLTELRGLSFGGTHESIFFNSIQDKTEPFTFPLPAVSLVPTQSIVVPVMMVLAPLANLDEDILPVSGIDMIEFTTLFSRADLKSGHAQFIATGPYILPEGLQYQQGSVKKYSAIHPVDLTRTYILNRHWQIGSCPHLFFEDTNTIHYVRELFSLSPNLSTTEYVVIPPGITKIHIAELEDEQTHLESITVNGRAVQANCILYTGDHLTFSVQQGDHVQLTGKYITQHTAQSLAGIQYRSVLVGRFLRQHQLKALTL